MTSLPLWFVALSCCFGPAFAAEDDRDFFQILYDSSRPLQPGFKPDFGYAVYIQFQGKRVLMDTGTDADIFANNVAAAGVDLRGLDAVVMTHNHHDHAGGLAWLRQQNREVPVYVPPGQDYPIDDTIVVADTLALTEDLLVMRGHTDTATAGIYDDLSLALRTADGIFVLSSCSHSGAAAIVDRAQQALGAQVLYFSGGARLIFRDPADTDTVARSLQQRGVRTVSPSHCSLSHRVQKRMGDILGPGGLVASRLGHKVPLPAR